MGSGGSTLNSLVRLRKAICIRAHNLRAADETLEDQFAKYSFKKNDNKRYICLQDVKQALSTDAPWIEDLFRNLIGNVSILEMDFSDFIDFLEKGKQPTEVSAVNSSSTPSFPSSDKTLSTNKENIKNSKKGLLPPTPPRALHLNYSSEVPTSPQVTRKPSEIFYYYCKFLFPP